MPLQNSSLLGRPKFQTGLVKTEVIDRLSRIATTSAPTSHPTFRRTRRMYMTHSRNPCIPLHSEVQEAGSTCTRLIRNREYGDRPVRTSKELHIRVCMGTWIGPLTSARKARSQNFHFRPDWYIGRETICPDYKSGLPTVGRAFVRIGIWPLYHSVPAEIGFERAFSTLLDEIIVV